MVRGRRVVGGRCRCVLAGIFHYHGLNLAGGQNGKVDAFCNLVAVGCGDFRQCIISCWHLFHIMWFVCGNPTVNLGAVLVLDNQFCAGKFFLGSKVFLGNLHLGNIILHNNGGIVQQFPVIPLPEQNVLGGQIVNFALLQRIAVLIGFLNQAESNIIGQCVPISGADLRQCVRFTEMQSGHAMRLIGGHPCGYGIAVRILDSKGGAGQFLIVGKVTFAYPHFRRLVGTGVIQHHNSLSIIGESDFHRLLVDVIAERGAEFLDDVITAVGGGVLADATAVLLAADGNIAIEVGGAVRIGFGAGGYQLTSCKNKAAVHTVNIVGSVQVEYRTRKVFAGFAVNFVNTYFGLFTVIVKF